MLYRSILAALLFAAMPVGAAALASEEMAAVVRGTEGLVDVPFSATNQGPGDITCAVALAHWYSLDLGRAAPGGRVEASLWFDPKDGTVALLNGLNDRMPVQELWCGVAGRSWSTRTLIDLERKAGGAPAPIRITCRPEAQRLACR